MNIVKRLETFVTKVFKPTFEIFLEEGVFQSWRTVALVTVLIIALGGYKQKLNTKNEETPATDETAVHYVVLVDRSLVLPDDLVGNSDWGLPPAGTPTKGAEEMVKMLIPKFDWTTPYDFEHGQIYVRWDVVQQPTALDYCQINILDEGGPGHHWFGGNNGGSRMPANGEEGVYVCSLRMSSMGQLDSVSSLLGRLANPPPLSASSLLRDCSTKPYKNIPWDDPRFYPATVRITWVAVDGGPKAPPPPWEKIVGVQRPMIRPLGYSYVRSYDGPVEVRITVRTPGSEIHYTLDGSDPNRSSPIYERPFIISSDLVVKAKAFLDGYSDSDVSFMEYRITGRRL